MKYKLPTIIVVMFDGTLCENDWPHIGRPNTKLINELKSAQTAGVKVILWNTLRHGSKRREVLLWCKNIGLKFDAVCADFNKIGAYIRFMGKNIPFHLEAYKVRYCVPESYVYRCIWEVK